MNVAEDVWLNVFFRGFLNTLARAARVVERDMTPRARNQNTKTQARGIPIDDYDAGARAVVEVFSSFSSK